MQGESILQKIEQFRTDALGILDHVAHPIWIFSIETLRISFANSAAQAWLLYEKQELEALSIADIRPEEERDLIRQRVRDMAETSIDAGIWTIVARSGVRRQVSFFWKKIELDGEAAMLATINDKTIELETACDYLLLEREVKAVTRGLHVTEDAFRSLFEAAPGKMLVITPGTHEIVAATDEYTTATMTTRNWLYGRNVFSLFPEGLAGSDEVGVRQLHASLKRVERFQTRDVMDVQRYPIRDRDGFFVNRYWLSQNKPVFNSSGDMVYIIHRIEDVTELSGAEGNQNLEKLQSSSVQMDIMLQLAEMRSAITVQQEQEARLRLANRMLKLGAWEFRPESKTHLWSARLSEIYGLSPAERVLSHDWFLLQIHPDDRDEIEIAFDGLARDERSPVEFRYRALHTNGSTAYLRVVGERRRIAGIDTIVGFIQDISDYVLAKHQLLEAQELIRRAGETLQIGGWRVNTDMTNLVWTDGMFNIFEIPYGQQPTFEDVLRLYSHNKRERVENLLHECAQFGRAFDEVVDIKTLHGKDITIRVLAWPIYDDRSMIIAVQGAAQDITRIRRAEREALEANAMRLDLLERISDAFFSLNADWRLQYLNSQAETLLEKSKKELISKNLWEEFPDAVGTKFEKMYRRAVDDETTVRFQEYYPSLGKWFDVTAYPTAEGLVVFFRDATDERRRSDHLRLLEAAAARMNDLLIITEAEPFDRPNGPKIVYVNQAVEAMTGWQRQDLLGKTPRILQGPDTAGPELEKLRKAVVERTSARVELINYDQSGHPYWVDISLSPIFDESQRCTHFIAVQRDISDWKRTEAEQRRAATTDALTGCLNRTSFTATLNDRLQVALVKREKTAVILIDCDNFKTINDTLGHAAGDALLKSAADRLKSEIGENGILGRLGGDEFIVFSKVMVPTEAISLAERLRKAMRDPFEIGEERLSITASLGIAIAPEDGTGADQIIRNADIAMYHSKSTGRNQVMRFDDELRRTMIRRVGLTQALQQSLTDRKGFWLAFQPQFCAINQSLVGAEALLRWSHADRGEVSPSEFIPAAENAGLMRMLDRMVVDLAARQMSEWIRLGIELHVSINMSAVSLHVEGISSQILKTLSEWGVPARLFGIEITESLYLENSAETKRNLNSLRAAGVTISIDDFGTGHSSLSYLQRLPLDVIKIDKSFIEGVRRGAKKTNALVKAVLAMAKALELRVVAEGIETDEQLKWLSRNGCNLCQGFLLGRPVDASSFVKRHIPKRKRTIFSK